MRRRRRTIQRRLFEPQSPTIPTTKEHREELVELLGALVQEVMKKRDALQTGGDHDADHA